MRSKDTPGSEETCIATETPEQAALAIAEALEFLRREACALGMNSVAESIGSAAEMASEAALAMSRSTPRNDVK